IIIIYLFTILLLESCGSSENIGEISRIKKSVESVEILLSRYDSNVQSAIDTRNFGYISLVSQEAVDSADIVIEKLKIIAETSSNPELVYAAISYTEALREVMIAEEAYSALSESLSKKEARQIDNNFLESSKKAQQAYVRYSSLLKQQSFR
ncbi:MAG TPA: hypothetical protein DIT04_03740, partial [Dysgonomonas sp.]|nr:hypothetical protein [Dysgonomonas sp.]